MVVAAAMRRAGASVIQSDYYTDPEDRKTLREIDVTATWRKHDLIEDALAKMTLRVECKQSRDKPWVAFTSRHAGLAGPARVVQRAVNPLGETFLEKVSNLAETQALPLFTLSERVAYGVTQAFTSGNDVAYQAMMSAAKAARATALEPQYPRMMEVIFPVVVIDGHLFECFLDDENRIRVEECEEVVVAWRHGVVDVHSIVHIVTLNALDGFSERAMATADGLLEGAIAHEFWKLQSPYDE
jgi:hypothetical protein